MKEGCLWCWVPRLFRPRSGKENFPFASKRLPYLLTLTPSRVTALRIGTIYRRQLFDARSFASHASASSDGDFPNADASDRSAFVEREKQVRSKLQQLLEDKKRTTKKKNTSLAEDAVLHWQKYDQLLQEEEDGKHTDRRQQQREEGKEEGSEGEQKKEVEQGAHWNLTTRRELLKEGLKAKYGEQKARWIMKRIRIKEEGGWKPKVRLPRERIHQLREKKRENPTVSNVALATEFGISVEAVIRILRTKWEPPPEKEERQEKKRLEQLPQWYHKKEDPKQNNSVQTASPLTKKPLSKAYMPKQQQHLLKRETTSMTNNQVEADKREKDRHEPLGSNLPTRYQGRQHSKHAVRESEKKEEKEEVPVWERPDRWKRLGSEHQPKRGNIFL
ncbi:Required for respiratory growth protein 9 mitochondrial [Balamuthia mandrillaris]